MYQFLCDAGIKEGKKHTLFPNFALIQRTMRGKIRYWECEEISQYLIRKFISTIAWRIFSSISYN